MQMIADIGKQKRKWRKGIAQNGITEDQRWFWNEEYKMFKPINPLPLQVFALTAVGHLCKRENADSRGIVPIEVLQKSMMKAVEHARDNPAYPLRGVNSNIYCILAFEMKRDRMVPLNQK